MPFRDRTEAGQLLAQALSNFATEQPVVLGLPRGGIPVAAEVALALNAPLDALLVRKLGVPYQPELAMGAIGEGGVRVLNESIVRGAGVTEAMLQQVETKERAELQRRIKTYRGDRASIDIRGRTVIIVDDGIATGATARAAIAVAREHGATRVILATPVSPPDTIEMLGKEADEVIVLETPEIFGAIGAFYQNFDQVSDKEVREALHKAGGSNEI